MRAIYLTASLMFCAIQGLMCTGSLSNDLPEGRMNAHKDAQVPTLVIKPLDKDREKKLGTIRELIWSHWQQREVGQVVATWLSKEGDQSDCTWNTQPRG